MGLFSNIFDGIKSAGQWALDHAADITPVVSAVGKAASLLLVAEGSNTDSLALSKTTSQSQGNEELGLSTYHRKFSYVSRRLCEEAKKSIRAGNKPNSVQDELVGLWRYPNGLSHNGEPSQTMYQDLSVFMASLGIPASYTDDSGDFHDTAIDVGKCLFANTGAEQLAARLEGDDLINHVTAMIPVKDGLIHSAHAYYQIPMGKGGQDFTLHSAIYIVYEPSSPEEDSGMQKLLSFSSTLQAQDSWLVTLNITWASAPTAVNAQTNFASTLKDNYPHLLLATSHVQGTLQLIKIQAPSNISPAGVKSAVQAVAMAAVNKKEAKSGNTSPAKNAIEVAVTDVSWLSQSSTSTH